MIIGCLTARDGAQIETDTEIIGAQRDLCITRSNLVIECVFSFPGPCTQVASDYLLCVVEALLEI